jgi:hypothetical protein
MEFSWNFFSKTFPNSFHNYQNYLLSFALELNTALLAIRLAKFNLILEMQRNRVLFFGKVKPLFLLHSILPTEEILFKH